MPLTLDEYADHLDTRADLLWPVPPPVDAPKARPHLKHLPGLRAVLWNVYGTLLRVSDGELKFEHANDFVMETALEKTIHEFKMWGSMSRKPGQPSAYMREIYKRALDEQRLAVGGAEKHPEVLSDRLWEGIVKKLFQKEYQFDAGFYGSLNEFARKVAYFFHASLQGTACYDGAAEALRAVAAAGPTQGLLGDGQAFTPVQLRRGLQKQGPDLELDELVPPGLRLLSYERRARKPSETLFREALEALGERGIEPSEVLHVGSSLTRDLGPAKRFGMRTALFAGDRASLQADPGQLKDPQFRPDVLVTELPQLARVVEG